MMIRNEQPTNYINSYTINVSGEKVTGQHHLNIDPLEYIEECVG